MTPPDIEFTLEPDGAFRMVTPGPAALSDYRELCQCGGTCQHWHGSSHLKGSPGCVLGETGPCPLPVEVGPASDLAPLVCTSCWFRACDEDPQPTSPVCTCCADHVDGMTPRTDTPT